MCYKRKEDIMEKIILNLLSIFALKTTRLNVNSACFIFAHQPKLPENAKSLREF